MNLQDVFYIVAIVTMGIHILTLIIVVIVLISIQKKISKTVDTIERRIENMKNFVTHPNVLATSIGKVLVDQATKNLSKIFKR